MKIIHCADIHLDSAVGGTKGNIRRGELLLAFKNLVEFAGNNNVSAVLIAGDLFDSDFVSVSTLQSVVDLFSKYKSIKYYVLRGNHGGSLQYKKLANFNLPNVYFFDDKFKTYHLGNVAISGCELDGNDDEKYLGCDIDNNYFNIVMLHGDIASPNYGKIDLKLLSESGVDYLALGHRHKFESKKLLKTSICYSGVLETRGFDEIGDTGFILLDINDITKKHSVQFVNQSLRRVVTVEVDISSATSSVALQNLVLDKVSLVSAENYLNLVLFGTLNDGVETSFLKALVSPKFYGFRLTSKAQPKLDLAELSKELSLRGEFVKLVLEIDDAEKQSEIASLGLQALRGEVLDK